MKHHKSENLDFIWNLKKKIITRNKLLETKAILKFPEIKTEKSPILFYFNKMKRKLTKFHYNEINTLS